MPKSAQFSLSWLPEQASYFFKDAGSGVSQPVSAEDGFWSDWLENHHAFAFGGRNGQINLLKEKRNRGSDGYWYAYRRRSRGMIKRYVGRSTQLSIERLEEIASLLANEEETGATIPAFSDEQSPETLGEQERGGPWLEPLLMPKLQLPRLQKSLLPRPHLLDLLDSGLERKLILISGPAGYGKTTLVGQWIADRRNQPDFPHIASVTFDEADNDPIRFWHYIIAACQNLHPEFGKEALELLLAHRLPPFKPLAMMLTVLLNELSQLEHPAILILDDFHQIKSLQVAEQLDFFLDHLPTSVHVFMLIRGDPPLSLARLRAHNEQLDIYPPFLAFSQTEIGAFFEQEFSFTLSTKLERRISERLAGWPAGLRLLARDINRSNNVQELEKIFAAFTGSYWSIQDYFLSEVLHTLPFEAQEFLLQSSVFPRITAALCDAVMEREDSAMQIEALQGGDLFLIPQEGGMEWSRYHPLFAEAMQQEARQRLGEEWIRQLSARASRWYEEHGYSAESIEAALRACEYGRATNLIERFIEENQQGNAIGVPAIYSLNQWLEQLPDEELERSPVLCVQYAMTLLFTLMEGPRTAEGSERIYQLLQMAEQKWRDANNTAKLAEIFSFRALLARQDGKLLQAVTWARQALAWLPTEDLAWRNLSLTVVGIGEILEGQLERAREYLLEARALTERQGNFIYVRAIRGMLCWVTLEHGELRHTAEQMRQIQAEARVQEDRDDIARTQLVLAHIAYQWNRLEEAEQAAREAFAIGEQMDSEEFQARAKILFALSACARGDMSSALQGLTAWLDRGQTFASPFSYQLYREVQATLARVQLVVGELAAVERWFLSIDRREEILPLLQRQREEVVRARLLLKQHRYDEAIEKLEDLEAACRQTNHRDLGVEVQVLLTLAYAQNGQPDKARTQLGESLKMAHEEGYLRVFLDEGPDLVDVLRRLLPHISEKILLASARSILGAFGREGGSKASEIAPGAERLLEPLSPQEQKVLRLLAAGNSNAEIARELVVSIITVRSQVQSIYRKLEVNNRFEAGDVARRLKLP